MNSKTSRSAVALSIMVCGLLLAADPALAQAGGGGDPFSTGVTWFIGGPARGLAMFAVAALAVGAWVFSSSLRMVAIVLGGGLALANVNTIVGWFGF